MGPMPCTAFCEGELHAGMESCLLVRCHQPVLVRSSEPVSVVQCLMHGRHVVTAQAPTLGASAQSLLFLASQSTLHAVVQGLQNVRSKTPREFGA